VVVLNCDLCGKTGQLFKVELEGSRIVACEECAKYGKILHEVKQEVPKRSKAAKANDQASASSAPKTPETVQLIVKDYSSKIKNAREKRELKQEDFAKQINEKESVLHQLESGRMEPNMELARKLEKALGIKIIEEIILEPEEKSDKLKASGPMTLGDMINLKKKKMN
jgi:putative transcription factor